MDIGQRARELEPKALDADSLRRSFHERLIYAVGKDRATATRRDWFNAVVLGLRDRMVSSLDFAPKMQESQPPQTAENPAADAPAPKAPDAPAAAPVMPAVNPAAGMAAAMSKMKPSVSPAGGAGGSAASGSSGMVAGAKMGSGKKEDEAPNHPAWPAAASICRTMSEVPDSAQAWLTDPVMT